MDLPPTTLGFFSEEQTLSVTVLIIIGVLLLAAAAVSLFVLKRKAKNQKGRLSRSAIVVAIAPLVLLSPVALFKIQTNVDSDSVRVQAWPFSSLALPLSDVRNVQVIEYDPITDFGGWGIRHGLGGKMYSAKGDRAVRLQLTSGRLVYIGTQRPGEFLSAIEHSRNGSK